MINSIKGITKYILAILLYYSGLLSIMSVMKRNFAKKGGFPILMYHRVLNQDNSERDYIQPGLFVSRRVFEKQMAFLVKKYNVLPLEKTASIFAVSRSFPPGGMAITFDDGWKDNYSDAYPVLKKYKVPATIFLTTDLINSEDSFWFLELSMILAHQKMITEKLSAALKNVLGDDEYSSTFQYLNSHESVTAGVDSDKFIDDLKQFDSEIIMKIIDELKKEIGISQSGPGGTRQALTWDEIKEMKNSGINFGSHGCSHRILLFLTDEEIESELLESKRVIEQKLGGEVKLFSYPNGDYDDRIKELTGKCGYFCAVTTKGKKGSAPGIDLLSLKRINIHDGVSVGPAGRFSRAMFSFHLFRNS